MKGKEAESRRSRVLVVEPARQAETVEIASGSDHSVDPKAELVRIVVKLTQQVERFDSMVSLQRQVLEHLAVRNGGTVEDSELNRQTELLTREAGELVTSVRRSLEDIRRL